MRRRIVLVVSAAALSAAAWVAFGWFGVQGLVVDDRVDEAPPAFATAGTTPTSMLAVSQPAGAFESRSHATRGRAIVLSNGASRVLRLEDFETENGPDLNVYLSAASADAPAAQFKQDYVDLGDLKGNVGAQNYNIARTIDLVHYKTVVVWCVRFSVAFGVAELT